jgi:hypothetical protein
VSNGLEKFTDLENRVYRVIELFRAVKLQKESLEKDVLRIKSQLDQILAENDLLKTEMLEYKREKDLVKDKLEAILQNLESVAES